MGSWNATCGITQLPITDGQRVVVIPLVVKQQDFLERDTLAGAGSTSNTIIAQPFSLPLFGTYDGYGGVKLDKAQRGTGYLNRLLGGLVDSRTLLEHPEGVPRPVKRATKNLFDRMLRQELLIATPNIRKSWLQDIHETYEEATPSERKGLSHYKAQLSVNLEAMPDDQEFALGAMLLPEALYRSLVDVAGAEKASGYFDDSKGKMVTFKGTRREELLHELTLTASQKKKIDTTMKRFGEMAKEQGLPPPGEMVMDMAAKVVLLEANPYVATLNDNFYFVDGGELAAIDSLQNNDEAARTLWVDFMLLNSAMNAMRKHWTPQAGAGSSCELYEVDKYYRAAHQFVGEALTAAEAAGE